MKQPKQGGTAQTTHQFAALQIISSSVATYDKEHFDNCVSYIVRVWISLFGKLDGGRIT